MIHGAFPGAKKRSARGANGEVPAPLAAFLESCRAADPTDRPTNGLTALNRLEQVLAPLGL